MPPAYAPPSCPLDGQAVTKLGELAKSHQQMTTYKSQIKEALKGLAEAIYDAQARLSDRQQSLKHIQSQRRQTNREKSEREQKLEEHVAELEEEVQDLTMQAEEMVRSCIDQQFAIEDDGKIVSELYTSATGEYRARGDADEENDQHPSESLVNKVRELREQKASEWEAESNYHRYAKNNEYINFKRLWREGAAGDDGPVLPNAEKWFDTDGEPVMQLDRAAEDDDDDVAVARETISLTCPLSLLPLKEPYTNKHCNHTFEKQSIVEWLKGSAPEQLTCPTTGCNQVSFQYRGPVLRRLTLFFRRCRGLSFKTISSWTRSYCGGSSALTKMTTRTWTWKRTKMRMKKSRTNQSSWEQVGEGGSRTS